jgi:hypothetical protein
MSAEPAATLDPELVGAILELETVHPRYVAGEFPEAVACCDRILETLGRHGETHGPIPARVQQSRGAALIGAGRPTEAMEALARGVAALGLPGGAMDDPAIRGALLSTTAHALRTLGRFRDARTMYEMAIPLLGEGPGEGLVAAINSLGALGNYLQISGRQKHPRKHGQKVDCRECLKSGLRRKISGLAGNCRRKDPCKSRPSFPDPLRPIQELAERRRTEELALSRIARRRRGRPRSLGDPRRPSRVSGSAVPPDP